MATIIDKIVLEDGTYAEIIDLDVSGSTIYITYHQIVLELADGSAFNVGDYIVGDNDNGNDGLGIVRQKLDANTVVVDLTSGTFIATNGVDNVAVYSADETTITSITQSVKSLRTSITESGSQIGTYL